MIHDLLFAAAFAGTAIVGLRHGARRRTVKR